MKRLTEITVNYKYKICPTKLQKITNDVEAKKVINTIYSKVETKDFRETCFAIYLNNALKVLGIQKLCEGEHRGTLMCSKLIYQTALKTNSSSVILVHNHPSQIAKASKLDIETTNAIRLGLKLLEIDLIDSFVYTNKKIISIK